jgi:hypothetical protein
VPLHLIKLSVGSEDVEDLRQWHAKRREELLAGGSIYWVIKGFVTVRQRLVGVERISYSDGTPATELVLDPGHVRTVPTPHRPFQGWRYLAPEDAPADLDDLPGSLGDMPPEMLAELRHLGLL